MQNRLKTLTLGLLTMLFLATACQPKSQENMEEAGEKVSQAVQVEKEALKEDVLMASNQIQKEIARLEEEMDSASGEARQELMEQKAKLQEQSSKLKEQLTKLDEKTTEGWNSLKAEVQQTVSAIEESVEKPAEEKKN